MAADPSGPDRAAPPRPAATIEPTLPLVMDVRFEAVERGAHGVSALLVVDLTGVGEVRDLLIDTILPAGLRPVGADPLPHAPIGLARGQARRFVMPVSGDATGRHEVRLEAVFTDVEGRTLRLGQGATLDPSAPAAGRSHLGAFEMMAVPAEEIRR